MKTILLALCLAVALSGCALSPTANMQKFLDKLPATDVTKVEHVFKSPLWSDTERVTEVVIDEHGLLDVTGGYAEVTVPLWGVVNTLSIEGFKQIPTPEQKAAAEALKAARARVRAEAKAAKEKAAVKP